MERHSFRIVSGDSPETMQNCAFPLNFYFRKSGEIIGFYAVCRLDVLEGSSWQSIIKLFIKCYSFSFHLNIFFQRAMKFYFLIKMQCKMFLRVTPSYSSIVKLYWRMKRIDWFPGKSADHLDYVWIKHHVSFEGLFWNFLDQLSWYRLTLQNRTVMGETFSFCGFKLSRKLLIQIIKK